MSRRSSSDRTAAQRLALAALAALVLVPPFVFVPTAAEAFRTPKLLVSSLLAVASLLCLSFAVRRLERIPFGALWRLPAVRATLPLLCLAGLSWFTTEYRIVSAHALVPLLIGTASLVGWSCGLSPEERQRLLAMLPWPAAALALLALLQATGLYRPLGLLGGAEASRLGVMSLAGNPGDLGAYLVLPCLLLQTHFILHAGARRWRSAALLALCVMALAATQTFTAIAALLAGSLLLWMSRLPRRRALLAAGGLLTLAAMLVLGVPQLRQRASSKATDLAQGNWNEVLSYRLDGWRAATWMLRHHPLTGVGHGAFRSQFAAARLDLADQGADFGGRYRPSSFANAHNDLLEVAAELGAPGLLAIAWASWVGFASWRRLEADERPLALAGAASLAVLAVGGFPFETALVIFPWLLFLSGILRPQPRLEPEAP